MQDQARLRMILDPLLDRQRHLQTQLMITICRETNLRDRLTLPIWVMKLSRTKIADP